MASWKKIEVRGKNEKGEKGKEKRRKITLKNGGKRP